MIGKGTRWEAKKLRGGLLAYMIVDTTAEDILRSRPSPRTGIRPYCVAEIPHHAGKPKERAEIALLIERAPLMKDVLLREAEYLRDLATLVTASPSQMKGYLSGMANRMKEAAGGPT